MFLKFYVNFILAIFCQLHSQNLTLPKTQCIYLRLMEQKKLSLSWQFLGVQTFLSLSRAPQRWLMAGHPAICPSSDQTLYSRSPPFTQNQLATRKRRPGQMLTVWAVLAIFTTRSIIVLEFILARLVLRSMQ